MKKLAIYVTAALSMVSCLGLDKFPLDSMSPDTFFSSEEELQAFSNTFYTMLPATSLYLDICCKTKVLPNPRFSHLFRNKVRDITSMFNSKRVF